MAHSVSQQAAKLLKVANKNGIEPYKVLDVLLPSEFVREVEDDPLPL